jgi:RNase P/RNase MRP subunit POP5
MDEIWHAVLKLYGEYGASQTRLTSIDYDAKRKIIILRTTHTTVDIVRAALASITRIRGKPVAIHVLRASGTIKALRKKMKSQIW